MERGTAVAPESILTRADYEEYLLRLYFGSSSDGLLCCLNRAYRDVSRTLHGLRALEASSTIADRAGGQLRQTLETLASTTDISQDTFDAWHQQTCTALVEIYQQHQHQLYIGQAQKWINMTLKYVFTFGESRLPGFHMLYPYCHVPIDNILIAQLAAYDPPRLSARWSRLADYAEYLHFQQWVRTRFATIPLDTEFRVWLGKEPSFAEGG